MSEIIEQLDSWERRSSAPEIPQAILDIAKVLGHESDYLSRIIVDEENGTCNVEWEWMSRGCHQGQDYDIPLSVLQSDDVAKAAKRWKLEVRREELRSTLGDAQQRVRYAKKELNKIDEELARTTP